MLTRRKLLGRALRASSLIAAGPTVPGFLASAARAAEPGGDTVLVVLELTGGNDGLNTVVPFADDLYHAARPTLRLAREQVLRVDDHLGLNPGLRGLADMLERGQLAIVQGVGYPNPDRSHFESMDVWHSADPAREAGDGWLGRVTNQLRVGPGQFPAAHVGTGALPLALQGASTGVPTIHPTRPFDLDLDQPGGASAGADPHLAARRRLIEDLAGPDAGPDPMLQFVRRTALRTYAAIDDLREVVPGRRDAPSTGRGPSGSLAQELALVGHLIAAGFGTRLVYLSIAGFDTHANQLQNHQQLLQQVGDAVAGFFAQLERAGQAGRVLLMTFSEFGRRAGENGSRGTDHGAASCVFVAGPGVRGGVVGAHPSLAADRLDAGDLRHHTDFRRVYATLLEGWLGLPAAAALGGDFERLPLLRS